MMPPPVFVIALVLDKVPLLTMIVPVLNIGRPPRSSVSVLLDKTIIVPRF